MYKTVYQHEINLLKRKYMEGYKIARDISPEVNIYSFVDTLKSELYQVEIKVNAIIRSNQHPSDEIRIQYFALRQLIAQIDTWSNHKPCYTV